MGPGQGRRIEGPVGGPLTFKAQAERTAGQLTAFENIVAPGEGPPLHVHERSDEAWYLLEGRLRFQLGSDEREADAGAFVYVPRGVEHCFQNVGREPSRILVLFTPAGMEEFFEVFAAGDASGDPGATFARASADADMRIVGPPLSTP
ncbi:MAG: cupin domain-containing protein [Solirubrobacterales bacterium]